MEKITITATEVDKETDEQRSLREAQERNSAFYEQLKTRDSQPNPLRAVIDDCIRRARAMNTDM
jgi:hypothetical protein